MVTMRKMKTITKSATALTPSEKRRILKTLGLKTQKELFEYVQNSGETLSGNAKAKKTKAFKFAKTIYNEDVKQHNEKLLIVQREKKTARQYNYRFNKNLKFFYIFNNCFTISKICIWICSFYRT